MTTDGRRFALVSLSPLPPCLVDGNQLCRQHLIHKLERAFSRYEDHLEPAYAFQIGDLLSLKRWLNHILPHIAEEIQKPNPDPNARARARSAEQYTEQPRGTRKGLIF
jgi:hypothetical protein